MSIEKSKIIELMKQLKTDETDELDFGNPSYMICEKCKSNLGISRPRKKHEHYIVCPNCGTKNYNLFVKIVPGFYEYSLINTVTGEEIFFATYENKVEPFSLKWMAEEYIEKHNLDTSVWEIVAKHYIY